MIANAFLATSVISLAVFFALLQTCTFLIPYRAVLWSQYGMALIGWGIFAYDAATPYPSFYTAVPVIGTALIILFGWQGTWTAKLLSTRPFVGIGLISYSLYLWHQPLFAFARNVLLWA